jgi:FKBP-type peptidyl-prolyl cis-trans isomerase 2
MNMQIAKNTVVTLDYNVTDPDGVLVDAGEERKSGKPWSSRCSPMMLLANTMPS